MAGVNGSFGSLINTGVEVCAILGTGAWFVRRLDLESAAFNVEAAQAATDARFEALETDMTIIKKHLLGQTAA